jgi:hypothetical protein
MRRGEVKAPAAGYIPASRNLGPSHAIAYQSDGMCIVLYGTKLICNIHNAVMSVHNEEEYSAQLQHHKDALNASTASLTLSKP